MNDIVVTFPALPPERASLIQSLSRVCAFRYATCATLANFRLHLPVHNSRPHRNEFNNRIPSDQHLLRKKLSFTLSSVRRIYRTGELTTARQARFAPLTTAQARFAPLT